MKSDQVLVVWHREHAAETEGTQFTYEEIAEMLRTGDFSAIAGYADQYAGQLRGWLQKFIDDVESDLGAG